jgi:hypothetical protein
LRYLTILSVIFIAGFFYVYEKPGGYALDQWFSKWTVLLWGCSVVVSAVLAKRLHWCVFPGVLCVLGSSVYLSQFRAFRYKELSSIDELAVKFAAAQSGLTFFLMVSALAFIPKRYLGYIAEALGYCCIIASLWIICKFFEGFPPYSRSGFITKNISMEATFIAITAPFYWFRDEFKRDDTSYT